jgi:Protein of unknown function (DUF2911)
MRTRSLAIGALLLVVAAPSGAQQSPSRPLSPAGSSVTQLGKDGKWIEISYGRPLRRGRDVFGSGANYAKAFVLQNGQKVWRAGANVTTRLKTDVPLQIGGKTVPTGEYSLFIDTTSPTDWTLIVSSWAAQQKYDPNNKDALWGSFGYTPDKDVARVAMKVDQLPIAIDQLTWNFADVTTSGGKLVIMWDKTVATAPFSVAQ